MDYDILLLYILQTRRIMFRALFILLATAAFCYAQAGASVEVPPSFFTSDSLEAERLALETRTDFNEHYRNLIEQEKKDINHKTNLAILGGMLIGGGGVLTAMYAKDGFDSDGQESLKEALRTELLIVSIGLTAIGVVGLSYNLYALFNKDGLYNQLESYKKAHEIYKRRRDEQHNGTKLALAPTFNIANSAAGMNMLILF
ncbi:hypothetical protein [Fibrobacter sp. UBA2449]|uniref:hypothetical protein n=1 Tax=Fibrobacter sp. UBA2449 TaxID=1946529 RepID=UPI0025BBA79B|nr:hypothetical protein [Fibrobacter sp. UBA2449]